MKINIEWLLTEKCNYTCEYCALYNNKIEPELNTKKIFRFLKNIKFLQIKNSFEFFIFGGEPFLHPKIDQILSILKKLKINYAIQTNGSLYEKIIKLNNIYDFKFKISIHPTQINKNYLNNLKKIISNTKNLESIDFMFVENSNLKIYFEIKKYFNNTILCPISNFLVEGFDESLKSYNKLFKNHLKNKTSNILFEKIWIKPKNNYRSFIWEEELNNKTPIKNCILNNGEIYDKFLLFDSNLKSFNCCFHQNNDIQNCPHTKCFYS